jgi:hypothetical protein
MQADIPIIAAISLIFIGIIIIIPAKAQSIITIGLCTISSTMIALTGFSNTVLGFAAFTCVFLNPIVIAAATISLFTTKDHEGLCTALAHLVTIYIIIIAELTIFAPRSTSQKLTISTMSVAAIIAAITMIFLTIKICVKEHKKHNENNQPSTSNQNS